MYMVGLLFCRKAFYAAQEGKGFLPFLTIDGPKGPLPYCKIACGMVKSRQWIHELFGWEVEHMRRIEDFVLENGVLTQYTGMDPVVVIPEGVEEISAEAFADCV